MSDSQRTVRMIRVSLWMAALSLALMLVTTITQLTIGRHSGFTLAANTVTIGLLSGTATLISKAIRTLKGSHGDKA